MQDAPAAPRPPRPAAVQIEAGPSTDAQTIPVPQSAQDIVGLRARRAELADQLEETLDRRNEVAEEWEGTPPSERASLGQVVAAMDGRIVQLEGDIATTERALTSARPELLAAVAQREDAARAELEAVRDGNREERMAVLFAFFLVFMLGWTFFKGLWGRTPPPRQASVESEGRLERIEQAVETMAIEIERVSEGQRFVTKLLSESKAPLGPQPTTHTGREI